MARDAPGYTASIADDSTNDADFDDPLAVRVGLYVGADELPCDGWPKTFKPEVVSRILGYLPISDDD